MPDPRQRASGTGWPRAFAATGAVGCALSVALGAYSMHATLAPRDHERLAIAARVLFAHGLALAALAPRTVTRWRRICLHTLLIGMILFSGSLMLAATCGLDPMLAPVGGSLLILGWLSFALASLIE
jgi:uncharacterized membrane protein YgdD (TMEM256/DUF423 family)